jgi:hypothetical protein
MVGSAGKRYKGVLIKPSKQVGYPSDGVDPPYYCNPCWTEKGLFSRKAPAGAHTVSRFVDWRTCQYHRNLHLSIRDVPVSLKKRRLVRWRDQLEAVARVEANCPIRSFPGANQDAPRAQLLQMPKESPTNAAPLAARLVMAHGRFVRLMTIEQK